MELTHNEKVSLFFKLREIKRITPWEDIKIGEVYHMPPLIYNKRLDFVVIEKNDMSIRVKKLPDGFPQTMYKSDMTSNFIVKKWCANEK